jgi:kynurenine formamidase
MGKMVFVDLSHPFGADMPLWPYFRKPEIDTMHGLAKSGVLSQKIGVVQHCGTHADAPRHVMERDFAGNRARYSHELPVDAHVGDSVCLDIKVEDWGLIKGEHLDDACERANIRPEELKGMVLCLRTGMHLKYDDSKGYNHYSSGTGCEAGDWFQEYMPKGVAMDMQALDHALHTAMGKNGPTQLNLPAAPAGRSRRSTSRSSASRLALSSNARSSSRSSAQTGTRRPTGSLNARASPGPGSPVTSS